MNGTDPCPHYKPFTHWWNKEEGNSRLPCPPDFKQPCVSDRDLDVADHALELQATMEEIEDPMELDAWEFHSFWY